jgi:hypothetical protein
MTITRLGIASVVLALAAVVLPAGSGATNECRGIQTCISVPGPWVVVPPHGEAQFLLQCPRRQGVVGGLDALATSRDVRVTFDALLGSPVGPGTTTSRDAFFRGVSARGHRGAFQPYLGCIPVTSGGRSTTAIRPTPTGPPLDRVATTIRLAPGMRQTLAQPCPKGERIVSGWTAIAFGTQLPPDLSLADAVEVNRSVRGGRLVVSVRTGEARLAPAVALLQIGAACAG